MKLIKTDKLLDYMDIVYSQLNDSDKESIIVSDENGKEMGALPRILCHILGIMHKTVYLVILDEHNQMLLQIRNDSETPRYDLPVAGHMKSSDKDVFSAIIREAHEEIGYNFQRKILRLLLTYNHSSETRHDNIHGQYCLRNVENRSVFILSADDDLVQKINNSFNKRLEQDLVSKIVWIPINKINDIISNNDVADGLR